MALTTPLTELEAVNELLSSIGQAPVNTVIDTGIADVNIARAELAKVTRFVQLQGFAFNTDEDYEFTPNVTGDILVPPGLLRFDTNAPHRNITIRKNGSGARALWDATNRTFTFEEGFKARVIWGFDFDDLPEAAKYYITLAAARKFQARYIGSRELDLFNKEDEERAWRMLQRAERAERTTNLFQKSPSLRRAYNRSRWSPTP